LPIKENITNYTVCSLVIIRIKVTIQPQIHTDERSLGLNTVTVQAQSGKGRHSGTKKNKNI